VGVLLDTFQNNMSSGSLDVDALLEKEASKRAIAYRASSQMTNNFLPVVKTTPEVGKTKK
jgi:hypothetical protein